jgi:hypothetical protein
MNNLCGLRLKKHIKPLKRMNTGWAVVVCNELIIARAHNLTETLNDATLMPRCRL